jgi:hypothetical protein
MDITASLDTVSDILDKYGVAVIPNIISDIEVCRLRNLAWYEFNLLTHKMEKPLSEDDPSSWRTLSQLMPLHGMLLQHLRVAHMQWLWDLRQNKRIARVFGRIHNVSIHDLLTSYDGCSLHLPPEVTNLGWYRNLWLHTDQGEKKVGRHSIQSLVNLYDVGPSDASLVVVPKSHMRHEATYKHFGVKSDGDWYKLDNQEQVDFVCGKGTSEETAPMRITGKAGDMFLWDSRTFHCGSEAIKGRPEMNIRMVGYICMLPRDRMSRALQRKHIEAFETGRVTNHNGTNWFPLTPRTWGKPLPDVYPVQPPMLNRLGFRLAGYD